jgi:hypothetical protein
MKIDDLAEHKILRNNLGKYTEESEHDLIS